MIAMVSLCLGIVTLAAQAKPEQAPLVDQAKVDEAIRKGCLNLLGHKSGGGKKDKPKGDLGPGEYRAGPRSPLSLVVLTLAHSGYTEKDPEFAKLVDEMVKSQLESTYTVGIQAMALQKIDARKYQWRLAECAHFLVHNQNQNGSWRYGSPIHCDAFKVQKKEEEPVVVTESDAASSPVHRIGSDGKGRSTQVMPTIQIHCKPEGKDFDNSNSQYAALGLRACLESGIEVHREVIANALKSWEKDQGEDGGFSYQAPKESYGSMSVGGLSSLCIFDFFLHKDFKSNPAVLKALKWLTEHYTVESNPNFQGKAGNHKWYLYYMYGLERACIIYGTEKIGSHWWYPEGAERLLASQKADGGWGGVPDTCFAILFLRRATTALIRSEDSRGKNFPR